MSNAVLVGESLCGMSHRNSGQFFCLDAKTGKTQWISPPRQATNAAVLSAGNVWFALKDDAEMLVLRAGATGFEPIRRYTVADSATWASPTIAGNRIFVKDVSSLTLWEW
jgi:outer membrane protein assembly factor BamB